MKPSEKVSNYLSQLDTRLKDLERTDHIVKTAYGITKEKLDKIKLPEFDDEDDVIDFCKELDARLQEVEHYRNPQNIYNQVRRLWELLEETSLNQAIMIQRFRAYDLDDRFIELFTDDDIKDYYTTSGLTATDVKKFLDKVENKNISLPTISLYVNAKVSDLKLRSLLGNYFKYEVLKKTKKNN